MNLREACEVKYGANKSRLNSIKAQQWNQPWFGFSETVGKLKYWPSEDVERWVTVTDRGMAEYLEELLNDPRQWVREGVAAHIEFLRRTRKGLPDWLRLMFERVTEGVA